MKVDKKKLYKEVVLTVKQALEKDDFKNLDEILEFSVGWNLDEDEYMEITDILDEATLYSELKEAEYKEEALAMIADFEDEIK